MRTRQRSKTKWRKSNICFVVLQSDIQTNSMSAAVTETHALPFPQAPDQWRERDGILLLNALSVENHFLGILQGGWTCSNAVK